MKFSVLLPTRNRLELLALAIETVRRQNYDNWEIIVSDNYSKENIKSYISSLDDSRIKYYRTDSFIPVTDNWNNALNKSNGDYVIMLGDDDCLMKDYFSTLSGMIKKFDSPDFIYTNAFLYAYPRVMPGEPDGFLRMYSNRRIFQSSQEPFWLKRDNALEYVRDSLDFRVTFDYNMQFSLVSRKLVKEMMRYGSFYQSPYPDYYASNALMLKAERILVVSQPLVTIGISPKSFGYYYFNDAENEGNTFLNNFPDQRIVQGLNEVILPGSEMNTSWLIAMQTLVDNFSKEFGIKVNYDRYRLIQIFTFFANLIINEEGAEKISTQFRKRLRLGEWLGFGFFLAVIAKMAPARYRTFLSNRLRAATNTHPVTQMPDVNGSFNTILDVFEQIDPISNDCRFSE